MLGAVEADKCKCDLKPESRLAGLLRSNACKYSLALARFLLPCSRSSLRMLPWSCTRHPRPQCTTSNIRMCRLAGPFPRLEPPRPPPSSSASPQSIYRTISSSQAPPRPVCRRRLFWSRFSSLSGSTRSYTELKSLGDGSFGTVWLCDWHGTLPPNTPLSPMQCGAGAKPEWAGKRLVAVKRMRKKWEGGWDECQKLKELEVGPLVYLCPPSVDRRATVAARNSVSPQYHSFIRLLPPARLQGALLCL